MLADSLKVGSQTALTTKSRYQGYATASIDANGHLSIETGDDWGRLAKAAQYLGTFSEPNWAALPYASAVYAYDVADRLVSATPFDDQQASEARMTMSYDAAGRKVTMTDPDMGTWSYGYDNLGNLVRQTDANGTTLCHEYDMLNRLVYVREDQTAPKDCTGTLAWRASHEYDTLNGQPVANGIGRRNKLTDLSGNTVWDYDQRGRTTKETKVIGGTGGGTFVTQWTYDAAENFRLTGLQSGVSPNYNTLQNLSYTYDDAGNALAITDAAAAGGSQTQSFIYDALNRLSTAQATGGSNGAYGQVSYSYNNAGNITNFEGTAFTYGDAAHKHAVTHLGGVQKYWYDANGNASRRVNFGLDVNYAYDAENRLTGVTGGKTATFTYDGDGRLVKTQVGSVYVAIAGTHYQYSGSTATKHYYAGDVRVAERVGTTLYWLLSDHLGSIAITANASGGNVAELRYYAYGKPRYNVGGQKTDYRYTGQRWQNDLGMYWYNSRWYDQLTGRFLQPDTIVPQPGDTSTPLSAGPAA